MKQFTTIEKLDTGILKLLGTCLTPVSFATGVWTDGKHVWFLLSGAKKAQEYPCARFRQE